MIVSICLCNQMYFCLIFALYFTDYLKTKLISMYTSMSTYLTCCSRLNHIFFQNTQKFITITDPYKQYQGRNYFLNAMMPKKRNVPGHSLKHCKEEIVFVDLESGKQICEKQTSKSILTSSTSGIVSTSNENVYKDKASEAQPLAKKRCGSNSKQVTNSDIIQQDSFTSYLNENIKFEVKYIKKKKTSNYSAEDNLPSLSLMELKTERNDILNELTTLNKVEKNVSECVQGQDLKRGKVRKSKKEPRRPALPQGRYFTSFKKLQGVARKFKPNTFNTLISKKAKKSSSIIINEEKSIPLQKTFKSNLMLPKKELTDSIDYLNLKLKPSHISPKKEFLGTDSVKLHNFMIDEAECQPEIILADIIDNSECKVSLQSKLQSVPINEHEEHSKNLDISKIQHDITDDKLSEFVSLPSTSCSQVLNRPYEKPSVETIDFMRKENIFLANIEYSLPIHYSHIQNRNYYDSLRPMVACKDSKAFSQQMLSNSTKHCRFTILNYNILSQRLLLDNLFLYSGCTREFLEWNYRWNLLQHEITMICPSILTLQEIDEAHYTSHFLPWLSYYGYKGIYKKRTGNKKDGCAIFFKADMFNVIEHKSIQYLQKRSPVLDRDNIGLMVKLTPKDFYEPFCIATTHLLYNPKRSDIRLLQMIILLAELDRFCYTGEEGGIIKYCPVILTGDFNSDPTSAVLRFLCQSKLKYDDLDAKSLRSAYGKPSIGNQLIPSSLGISNYCHHSALDKGRSLDRMRGSLFALSDKRKLEESLIGLGKNCHQSSNTTPDVGNFSGSQGTLYHRFNFEPVYEFTWEDVTTFHRSWITVDYIFYSRNQKNRKSNDNSLVLLSKYQLPGLSFARNIGNFPSAFCPSDHFPLAATFALSKQTCESAN